MRAFVDTIETKEQAIANLEALQANWGAYRVVQCDYHGEYGHGCAFVCNYYGHYYSADINDFGKDIYSQAERVHGIPRALSRLEDTIFEGLNKSEAREWPLQYLRAINVGSDLSQVTGRFVLRILEDEDRGMISFVQSNSAAIAEINRIVKLYRRKLEGEDVKQGEWSESTSGFRAAAWGAAYAAAYAASSAANVAASYEKTTAMEWYAKRQGHYTWMRDVLLDIIKNTKNSED